MAKVKGCNVVGIERVEGKRKSDGKDFGFWKLHCIVQPTQHENVNGSKTATCTLSDEDFQNDNVTVGSTVTLIKAGFNNYEYGFNED